MQSFSFACSPESLKWDDGLRNFSETESCNQPHVPRKSGGDQHTSFPDPPGNLPAFSPKAEGPRNHPGLEDSRWHSVQVRTASGQVLNRRTVGLLMVVSAGSLQPEPRSPGSLSVLIAFNMTLGARGLMPQEILSFSTHPEKQLVSSF